MRMPWDYLVRTQPPPPECVGLVYSFFCTMGSCGRYIWSLSSSGCLRHRQLVSSNGKNLRLYNPIGAWFRTVQTRCMIREFEAGKPFSAFLKCLSHSPLLKMGRKDMGLICAFLIQLKKCVAWVFRWCKYSLPCLNHLSCRCLFSKGKWDLWLASKRDFQGCCQKVGMLVDFPLRLGRYVMDLNTVINRET